MPSVREKARQPFPHNLWGSGSFRSPRSLLVFLPFVFAVKDKCWEGEGRIVAFLPPEMFQKEKQSKLILSSVWCQIHCTPWKCSCVPEAALWAVTGSSTLGLTGNNVREVCGVSSGVPPCAAHKLLMLRHVLKNSWQTALLWMMASVWYWFLFPIGMSRHFQHGTGNSDRFGFLVLMLSSWMLWLKALYVVIKKHVMFFPARCKSLPLREHLTDFKAAELIFFIFWSNHCKFS